MGKCKESDPTDALADVLADASVDCRSTVGRQSADSWPTRRPLFNLVTYKLRR